MKAAVIALILGALAVFAFCEHYEIDPQPVKQSKDGGEKTGKDGGKNVPLDGSVHIFDAAQIHFDASTVKIYDAAPYGPNPLDRG